MVRVVFKTLSDMYEGAYLRKPLTIFTSSSHFHVTFLVTAANIPKNSFEGNKSNFQNYCAIFGRAPIGT